MKITPISSSVTSKKFKFRTTRNRDPRNRKAWAEVIMFKDFPLRRITSILSEISELVESPFNMEL